MVKKIIIALYTITFLVFGLVACSYESKSNKGKELSNESTIDGQGRIGIINEDEQPLYVINEEIIPDLTIELDPAKIDSVVILKGNEAVMQYGDEGKRGVVKIYVDAGVLKELKGNSSE